MTQTPIPTHHNNYPDNSTCPTITLILSIAIFIAINGISANAQNTSKPTQNDISQHNSTSITATRPETNRLTSDQKRDLDLLLNLICDPRLDLQQRQNAAASLISRNWTAANEALADLMSNDDTSPSHIPIALAIAQAHTPPTQLVQPLLNRIAADDEQLRAAVAEALAQYQNEHVVDKLIVIAQNNDLTENVRHGSIEALAEHRQIASVKTLIKLISPRENRSIRQAALRSLEQLTGITNLGNNIQAWNEWWQKNKDLPVDDWLKQLIRSLGMRNRQLQHKYTQLQQRLADTYNQLYVTTDEQQRPTLLQELLSDQSPYLRLLASNLIERRLYNSQTVSDEVRQALRTCLSDADPRIRIKASLLLRTLKDDAGADIVADLLQPESDPYVKAEYLHLLTELPRSRAVESAIWALDQAVTRSRAAEFLVAAVTELKLNDIQKTAIATTTRHYIKNTDTPDAAAIILLGHLATDQDAPTYDALLNHEILAIRQAATTPYATGLFDLAALLPHMSDIPLLPNIIDVIALRGKTANTALELIKNKPSDQNLAQRWKAAIVAVAGRLPVTELTQIDDTLLNQPDMTDLRLDILGTLFNVDTQLIDTTTDLSARVILLVRLAELQLDNDPQQALTTFDQLSNVTGISASIKTRIDIGRVKANLAAGDATAAIETARQIPNSDTKAINAIVDILLDAADDALKNKQATQTESLLGTVYDIANDTLNDQQKTRANSLRGILQNAHIPANPTPTVKDTATQ